MNRKERRQQWLSNYFKATDFMITAASEDASFRSYYRVTTGEGTYILMDAPPQQEDCRPFVKILKLLQTNGLNVPHLYESDFNQGFLLLQDFGDKLYLDELTVQSVDSLYSSAINCIIRIQNIKQTQSLPIYDQKLLMNEMNLFSDWYIDEHLGVKLSTAQAQHLSSTFEFLVENATDQPQVMVHRDFHSRNLMVTEASGLDATGIIDFQDAVLGPFTYDLASLLKDCYVNWPESTVHQFLTHFLELYNQSFKTQYKIAQLTQWFDLMAAQRHLKAIGIFCRLNYRDGKPAYLNDIPRTMNYLLETTAKYPELSSFHSLLKEVNPQLHTNT